MRISCRPESWGDSFHISMNVPIIDDRLYLAASFVREGAVAADVGTDHAYIPIFLVNTEKCPAAVASDINEGPLERARINAEKYGAADSITFVMSDGLCNIPLDDLGVTDIVICGMGGELIARIIGACDYVKNENIRLILQPMTKPDQLRKYLSENGFEEVDGGVAVVDKVYQCLVCRYTGKPYSLTDGELLVGKCHGIRKSESFALLAEKYIKAEQKKLQSPEREKAQKVIDELSEMIEKNK